MRPRNKDPSRSFVPMMSGTRATSPLRKAAIGWQEPSVHDRGETERSRIQVRAADLKRERRPGELGDGRRGDQAGGRVRALAERGSGTQDVDERLRPAVGEFARVDGVRGRALRDRAREQPASGRCCHEGGDGVASGRLAEDRDVSRVASECGDVVAHPLEGGDLVAQAEVVLDGALRRRILAEMEPSERPEAVVETDVDDSSAAHEALALAGKVLRRSRAVAAAVNEHHDRQGEAAFGGSEHVDGEAVLAGGDLWARTAKLTVVELRRDLAVPAGVADTRPRDDLRRTAEPKLPHRRSRVVDPPPGQRRSVADPAHDAAAHPNVQIGSRWDTNGRRWRAAC